MKEIKTFTVKELVAHWRLSDKQVRRRLKQHCARAYRFNDHGEKEFAEKEINRIETRLADKQQKRLNAFSKAA